MFCQYFLFIETILNDFNCKGSTTLLESLNIKLVINLKISFLAID